MVPMASLGAHRSSVARPGKSEKPCPVEEEPERLTSLCLGKMGQSTLQYPACPQIGQGSRSRRGIGAVMPGG